MSTPAVRAPGEWRLGSVAGIPVLVRASWFVVAAVIAVMMAPRVDMVAPGLGGLRYLAGFGFAVLLYLSVLLHEIAHALMARRFGLSVAAIRLEFLGGLTEINEHSRTPGQEFWVAVVGPLTSLLIGGAALVGAITLQLPGLLGLSLDGLAAANLFVGVFNLLPAIPLDGGKVLRALVWKVSGSAETGTVVAAWGGRVLAVLIGVLVLASFALRRPMQSVDILILGFVAMFIWRGSSQALAYARFRRRMDRLDLSTLTRPVVQVLDETPVSQAVARAGEAGAGGIVVLDSAGRIRGLVSNAALAAVPEERRPWLAVSSVARSWSPEMAVAANTNPGDLLAHLVRQEAGEVLLLDPAGQMIGIVTADDLAAALTG